VALPDFGYEFGLSSSIEGVEVHDQLRDYQLLKKITAPWSYSV
jgi:hypothetical protein